MWRRDKHFSTHSCIVGVGYEDVNHISNRLIFIFKMCCQGNGWLVHKILIMLLCWELDFAPVYTIIKV